MAPVLNLSDYLLVFPNAPLTHPYASTGRMWYGFPENFTFQTTPGFGDRPDLATSRQQLMDWLKQQSEVTGIPLSRTILGGFSQGGAMTLDVGINLPLAGLMVLSGYLHAPLQPIAETIPPILMVHGRLDTIVPLTAARQARDSLQALGAEVQYHEFEMGHEIQYGVLGLIQQFVHSLG